MKIINNKQINPGKLSNLEIILYDMTIGLKEISIETSNCWEPWFSRKLVVFFGLILMLFYEIRRPCFQIRTGSVLILKKGIRMGFFSMQRSGFVNADTAGFGYS